MHLDYLDFDYSEDADGTGTFDAMASVSPARLAALHGEIIAVLHWAHTLWPDACGATEDGGVWQYDLQGTQEVSTPLVLEFDVGATALRTRAGTPAPPRTTVSFTVSGSADFCAALRDAFEVE